MNIAGFRKFGSQKQGLKVLIYGSSGCGKSVLSLGFLDNIVIDTEAKIGSYENNKNFSKMNAGVFSTNNFHKILEVFRKLLKSNDLQNIKTIILDSETKLYKNLLVSMLEIEEKRAEAKAIRKAKKDDEVVDIDFLVRDANIAQRGYGKVNHKTEDLSSLRAIFSDKGKVFVTIAHSKDVQQKMPDGSFIKIGTKPDLHKNSEYDFDLIIELTKEKDLINGKFKHMAIIEKDTYHLFDDMGSEIDITLDDYSKGNVINQVINKYISSMDKDSEINNNFEDISSIENQEINNNEEYKTTFLLKMVDEFKSIYSNFDKEKQKETKEIIKKYTDDGKISSINTIEDMDAFMSEIKSL